MRWTGICMDTNISAELQVSVITPATVQRKSCIFKQAARGCVTGLYSSMETPLFLFLNPPRKTIYYKTSSLKTGLDLLSNSGISAVFCSPSPLKAKNVLLMDNVGNNSRVLSSSSPGFCHKTPRIHLQN